MPAGNVLVLSGGKWVGMVLQLRQAMRDIPELAAGRILVASMLPLTPGGYFADEAFVVPPIADPDYVDALLHECRARNIRARVLPIVPGQFAAAIPDPEHAPRGTQTAGGRVADDDASAPAGVRPRRGIRPGRDRGSSRQDRRRGCSRRS